jgi:hypothetical protein
MDPRELGWGMEWVDLAQDRHLWPALVNMVKIFGLCKILVKS